MKNFFAGRVVFFILVLLFVFSACSSYDSVKSKNEHPVAPAVSPPENEQTQNFQTPKIPNLQSEILNGKHSTTASPLGTFDFKNYTYPLPRGWQDADGKDAVLENGKRSMSEVEKKIGLSYLTTKFFDVTGDGEDEAFVILKIDTAGSGIPQLVYIFTWENEEPELIWNFRTGDRADGGLKNFWMENGELVVELYGQDRYLFGGMETMKITGDEEQICCPTHFTKSRYKWNGKNFLMQGKRLTYSTEDKNAPPIENKGEIIEKDAKK